MACGSLCCLPPFGSQINTVHSNHRQDEKSESGETNCKSTRAWNPIENLWAFVSHCRPPPILAGLDLNFQISCTAQRVKESKDKKTTDEQCIMISHSTESEYVFTLQAPLGDSNLPASLPWGSNSTDASNVSDGAQSVK